MIRVYENFVNDFLYPDIDNILVFAENHDTQRINQAYQKFEDYKLAMTLVATVRGIPQIYYGSEIGMAGDKSKGDPDIRHDFPGGLTNDAQNAFTASGRTEKQNQYHDFTSRLFNWRKNQPVIHKGKTTQYVPHDNVYVYFRHNDEKTVMVVLNNSTKEQSLKTDRFKESIWPWQFGQDVLSGYQFDLSKDIKVAPKTPLILELK